MAEKNVPFGTATAAKALDLLDIVAAAPRPLRLKEMVAASELPKPTVHRLLQLLQEYGMLRHDPEEKTFHLGPRLFELSMLMWDKLDLPTACEAELLRLRKVLGETSHVGMLRGTEVVYVAESDMDPALKSYYLESRRLPAHCTAVGKAVLAFSPSNYASTLLSKIEFVRYTPNTITSHSALLTELEVIRARGYAIDDREQSPDTRCVAAPIVSASGVVGAIGIMGPAFRLTLDECHRVGSDVIGAARRISANLRADKYDTHLHDTHLPAPARASDKAVKVALPSSAFLGESPLWCPSERKLYWVDILAPALHCFDIENEEDHKVSMPNMIGSIAFRKKGGFVAALQHGIGLLNRDGSLIAMLSTPEAHLPGHRFNEGKCDRQGRFWAGTMSMAGEEGACAVYRVDTDLSVTQVIRDVGVANGMGWSPDGCTMYFTDSRRGLIWAYDYNTDEGTVFNRRVFAEVPQGQGTPGGLTVDSAGQVWSTHWGGHRITCYSPKGAPLRAISLPIPQPSSLTFGGPDLKTVYVTSSRAKLTTQQLAEAPLSGSIFSFSADVAGLNEPEFLG